MPSDRAFWDRIAERYSKQPIADEAAYQKKLAKTREYLRPDMEVLELGCGTGSTALLHAPHVAHIRAIDLSPKMIEIARRKAESESVTNVTFEVSSVDELEVADGSLGAVLGLSILHLLEDRDAAIARVHRWLAPGGVFVTSTVCLGASMKFMKLVLPIGRLLGRMPLVKVFSADELEASLTDTGFEIAYRWQPGRSKAVFLVARKGEGAPQRGAVS